MKSTHLSGRSWLGLEDGSWFLCLDWERTLNSPECRPCRCPFLMAHWCLKYVWATVFRVLCSLVGITKQVLVTVVRGEVNAKRK